MKKKCKVVRLATDKASCIIRESDGFLSLYHKPVVSKKGGISQHLYFINDDEIKDGDWCLFFWDGNKEGELGQIGSEPQQYFPENGHTLNKNLRKIIATTDPELNKGWIEDLDPERKSTHTQIVTHQGLPKPSVAFIEEYCRKGGIDEVDVEYNTQSFLDKVDGVFEEKVLVSIKVDSNNCIIIHPIKDSWTREETENLIRRAMQSKGYTPECEVIEFIKENL